MKTKLSSKMQRLVQQLIAFVNLQDVDFNRNAKPVLVPVPTMKPTFLKKEN
ncbi:hypothetical protein [Segetibacter sp. 3557_3]|uniref:hypothetical protein n=1 Tax=Segetibacter sp. 3557_3 TaxID=2547429 RepID=UPI001404B295|nr:hypothetical protein [Segetibacter sp. 3557_3]